MPHYGDDLRVAHRWKHSMKTNDNPFCSRCHLRTFPQWGPHDCGSLPDVRRIRHVAGDILSNLHFYRVPAEVQIVALVEALAFSVGDNTHPDHISRKWTTLWNTAKKLTAMQSDRVRSKTQAQNIVMDVHRPRLKAKRSAPHGRQTEKTHRSDRQTVPTRKRRR